jgi:hypothetical protein
MEYLNFWIGTLLGQALLGLALVVFVEILAVGRRLEAGVSPWPSLYDLLDLLFSCLFVAIVVFLIPLMDALVVWTGVPEWLAFLLLPAMAILPIWGLYMLRRSQIEPDAYPGLEDEIVNFRHNSVTIGVFLLFIGPGFLLSPS